MSELMMNPKVMRKLQGNITAAFRGKEFITEIDLRMSGSCIKYLDLVIKEIFKLYAAATILVPSEQGRSRDFRSPRRNYNLRPLV